MNPLRASRFVLALVLASSSLCLHAADNWPQWRGPQANGVAADGDYPVEFSAEEGVAWKIELPGLGMSTPAVWDDRIFVTCGIDGQDGVLAYDFAGQELWRRSFSGEEPGKRQTSSGSNPSPATDGEYVVAYYKSGALACLTVDGTVLWQKNLHDQYGPDTLWWDVGTSPLIVGDRVVVAVMQGPNRGRDGDGEPGQSYLVAYDLASGEVAWKTPREYKRPAESDNSYTTPLLLNVDGREVIVTFGADHLTGHDPADGTLLWDLPGFNPRDEANWRVIASPAVGEDMLLIPYGRARFLAGVKLSGKPEIVWERDDEDLGADVPTPIGRGDEGFVLTDTGRVVLMNMATGDEIRDFQLPRNRNKYYASPVLGGANLYCVREDGVVFVVGHDADGFTLKAENDMGEQIIATPIPIRGGLLLRGDEHLFRIGGEGVEEDSAG